ncbi:MAG: single-stranded DNA-binding protein [Lentisphaerales bacterium]|nr:single-stranded DNA-binding protein [Lentisphaerales bacterium]
MASFNKVLLMGNLTRNPELRYTGGGSAVCTLGLAVNRSYKTSSGEMRDETCFIDVTVWGKQAESCNNYLTKGAPVFVEGILRQETWTDKNSGQNRSKHLISADRIQFLGSPQRGAGGFSDNPNAYQQQPAQQYQQPAQQYQQPAAAPVQPQQQMRQAAAPAQQQMQQAAAPAQQAPAQQAPAQQAPAQQAPSFKQPAPQSAAAPQAAPAPSFEPPPMPEFNTEAEDDIPF